MYKKVLSLLVLMIAVILHGKTLQKLLDNGMTIVVKENHSVPTVAMNCLVKTGSIHEGKLCGSGMSHYLEHLVSSGTTTKRTEDDYVKMVKDMGMETNASTNQYRTDYYLTADKQYAPKMLEMLSEYMQFSVLNPAEVKREQEVIQKEIIMSTTDPDSRAYQKVGEILCANSQQKYPVIGYLDLFNQITRDDLLAYYHARYAPNNMIFTAVGNFDADSMLTAIEKQFAGFKRGFIDPRPVINESYLRVPADIQIDTDMKLAQSFSYKHIPDLISNEEISLDVVHFALFGKRSSLLNYRLTEELKLVNWIYGTVSRHLPDGSSSLAEIGFEPKNPANIALIREKIQTGYAEIIKDKKLAERIIEYRRQLEAEIHLTNLEPTEEAAQINHNVIFYKTPNYQEQAIKVLNTLTPDDLIAAVKKHILNGAAINIDLMPKDFKIATKSAVSTTDKTVNYKVISPDLTVIHFQNSVKPIIETRISLPINTYQEELADAGLMNYTASLIFKGSKSYAPLPLTDWLETHHAELYISMNNFRTMISFRCLKEDYAELQNIMIDCWSNPLFAKTEVELALENFKAEVLRNSTRPDNQHDNFCNKIIYKGQRSAVSDEEILKVIETKSANDFKQLYNKYFKADKFSIAFSGDLDQNEAVKLASELAAKMKNGNNELAQIPITTPVLDSTYTNKYQSEKVNIHINFPAPTITDADFKVFQVINTILNGSYGRLHEASRGNNEGLAYFAGSRYDFGSKHGFFYIYSQTSAEKKERLLQVLNSEVDKLQKGKLTSADITSAIEQFVKTIQNNTTDDNRAFIALNNLTRGLGYDYFEHIEDGLKTVTVDDIKRVATKYLSKRAIFISEPASDFKN